MKLEAAQKRPNGPGLVRVRHYLFRSEQHVFFFLGFSLSRRSVIFFWQDTWKIRVNAGVLVRS